MAGFQNMDTEEGIIKAINASIQKDKEVCEELMKQYDPNLVCNVTWDKIMCWPAARPGQLIIQQCPLYLNADANATKLCTENGWYKDPETQNPWTNYSECVKSGKTTFLVPVESVNSSLYAQYLPPLNTLTQIGYGVSLSTLIIAFLILASLKKLHCPRNMLHLHLFMSFIMKAAVTFLKKLLFEQGIGLRSDFVVTNGSTYYNDEINDNWECKTLTTVWQYFIMANYSWILMEGLYIHNLIMFALFADNSSIFYYVNLGWGLPMIFISLWAYVRIKVENTLCWTTNSNPSNFLIIRVPTTISVLLNFVLFVNIVRVLLVKIRSSVQDETQKYWKWAKSTLVLVPLFGVHYAVFLGMSFYSLGEDDRIELVWLYCDQLFASFQGFFVAVLYCFLNSEVQTEVRKKWRRCVYHGRVIDQDHPQRSNMASWPSTYSINRTCSVFMLCSPFSSRYRSESKASKKTETTDFICNDSMIHSINVEKDPYQKQSFNLQAFTEECEGNAELKLMNNYVST